ncbi:hypothetical protein CFP56_012796, partial [Quercus suber]
IVKTKGDHGNTSNSKVKVRRCSNCKDVGYTSAHVHLPIFNKVNMLIVTTSKLGHIKNLKNLNLERRGVKVICDEGLGGGKGDNLVNFVIFDNFENSRNQISKQLTIYKYEVEYTAYNCTTFLVASIVIPSRGTLAIQFSATPEYQLIFPFEFKFFLGSTSRLPGDY